MGTDILRYVSVSCFQLRQVKMCFSLGLDLSFVSETGGKIHKVKVFFSS